MRVCALIEYIRKTGVWVASIKLAFHVKKIIFSHQHALWLVLSYWGMTEEYICKW